VRRYFKSLRPADVSAIHSVPDGIFLVRVDRAQYRWHKQKPYYEIRFAVLKPKHLTGCFMTGAALLHTSGYVEAELVPTRIRLRRRIGILIRP
jgi:hypothetical protein